VEAVAAQVLLQTVLEPTVVLVVAEVMYPLTPLAVMAQQAAIKAAQESLVVQVVVAAVQAHLVETL